MTTRNVIFCSYGPPAADRDSGSKRLRDLMGFLQGFGWKVDFVATNSVETPAARELRQSGIGVFSIDSLPALLQSGRVDLVIAAFWPVGELVIPTIRAASHKTRIIVDSVDLHYLREARRLFTSGSNGQRHLLNEDFGAQLVGELNVYAAADGVLTVSESEATRLDQWLGGVTPVASVPDCESLPTSPYGFAERRGILTVGSYEHPPNVQAVEYLCREVIPLLDPQILKEHPLYVVGNGLSDEIRSYAHGIANVRMVGWVPTVTEYFHRCRISVVPLRYGAGTKRKMVQALMTGTPTVTTSIGAEGLGIAHEQQALIADSPSEFAAAMTRLLNDEPLWQAIAGLGRSHLLQSHSPETSRSRLSQFIDRVFAEPSKTALISDAGRDRYNDRLAYQQRQQHSAHVPAVEASDGDSFAEAVAHLVPEDSKTLIISKGDERLLAACGPGAMHFPQDESGSYAGYHPADSDAAIRELERLIAQGAEYLVVPKASLWWLDYYRGFSQHLRRFEQVVDPDGNCIVYVVRSGVDVQTERWGVDSISTPALPRFQTNPIRTSAIVHKPIVRRSVEAPKLIAFFLPQFHPIPENDTWWGPGFTEWTNVAKARPLFQGHYQPHLPTDLGYYDLRLSETRQAQADLARQYGIHGFCYYHYWFHGKMLLERPFNDVLSSGEPDFPFCLCWANEPWSRRWDGRNHDVLQAQMYSHADDLNHIRWLLPALTDRRAITVNGDPLFLVYQARELPDPARTVEVWRKESERQTGQGLHLVAVETGWDAGWDATEYGFDAKVLFQPQFSILGTVPQLPTECERLKVFDYSDAVEVLSPEPVSYLRYDTVCPMWDNSARKGQDGWVLHNSTPEAYEQWLRETLKHAMERPREQRLVFLNAWNEWAEGCHLEPDRHSGHTYLNATRQALAACERSSRRLSLAHSLSAAIPL